MGDIYTKKTLKDLEELHRKYNIKERDSNRQSGLEYSSNYIIGRNSANEPELITMTYNKTTECSTSDEVASGTGFLYCAVPLSAIDATNELACEII